MGILGGPMIIYWRVCERQNTQSFASRWRNLDKRELLRKCWLSVQQSVMPEDVIIISHEAVRQETLDWLAKNNKAIQLILHDGSQTPEKPYYTKLTEVMDEHTKAFPQEIHYLCNDDFLHLPEALVTLKSVYEEGWNGFTLLYDYPDRYTLDLNRKCDLFLGSRSHWRTVPSCTGCTSARGSIWQQHMKIFKQNALYNSDSFTWEAYAKSGAICPIPGLATHLTQNCMTPRVNWDAYYDSITLKDDWK